MGPPVSSQQTSVNWARPQVLKGAMKIIRDVAIAVIGDIEGLGSGQIFTLNMLAMVPVRPPWWGIREATVPDMEGKPPLVQKALLLMRDYQDYAFWTDHIFGGNLLAGLKTASPEKRREINNQCGYFLFIAKSLVTMGREIHQEASAALNRR